MNGTGHSASRSLGAIAVAGLLAVHGSAARPGTADVRVPPSPRRLAVVDGLSGAEAVSYDSAHDAYYVSNVNGSVETGIGNLANLQLAAAAPAAVLSCVVPVSTPTEAQSGQVAGIYYKDDLIAAPMRFVDGAIELPVGAGMGIAADEAKIRRYGVGGKG